jgi:EmrB/QacA subfamily drug resistance transporter
VSTREPGKPDGTTTDGEDAPEAVSLGDPRRWKLLWTLAVVQFLIFLDATIVNVALPSIQADLGFSNSTLTWVVNGYLLAAGGLLLLGGRLGDAFGRRRVFVTGAVLFGVASTVAALSTNAEVLMAARVVQGVAEALAAPAALGLIALTFTDPKEMQKAFGIWGGLAGLGSVSGVLLSGVLTDLISWRWIFWISVPLAVVPALLIFRLTSESRMSGKISDGPLSALLVTGGSVSFVHGVLQIPEHGPASPRAWVPIALGLVLLASFFALQARSKTPLLPLSFLRDGVRASGYVGLGLLNAATAGMFFLLVLYMQILLGYSPLQNGLAWVPYCVVFLAGLQVSIRRLPAAGIRVVMGVGLIVAAIGMTWLAARPLGDGFWEGLLPGMLIVGFGGGITFPAAQTAALSNLSMQDAGLGSGVVAALGQLGQAVGLAVLTAVALGIGASGSLTANSIGIALWVSAATLLVAAIGVVSILGGERSDAGKVPA